MADLAARPLGSVATAVGFIALTGVAAEFGVVMLIYLQNAWQKRLAAGEPDNEATLLAAIREGAAPLLSMLVVPAAWYLLHRKRRRAAVPDPMLAPELS